MTQKELLYLEDAIGHEKSIISIIDQSVKMLEDTNLKSFLKTERSTHQTTLKDLMSTLKSNSNA